MNARIDHLVIAADSLEQGAAWCVAMFGVQPSGGGKHPLMGTHNRVMAISSAQFPDCYLEIIAIDPEAPAPGRPRWFGLDQSELREAVRERPRLVHAVARTRMIETLHRGLLNCALNPGEPQAAQRETPNGLLKWRITVRDDGRAECDGALPSLIEWQGPHPCAYLPSTELALQALDLRGTRRRLSTCLSCRPCMPAPSTLRSARRSVPRWNHREALWSSMRGTLQNERSCSPGSGED